MQHLVAGDLHTGNKTEDAVLENQQKDGRHCAKSGKESQR